MKKTEDYWWENSVFEAEWSEGFCRPIWEKSYSAAITKAPDYRTSQPLEKWRSTQFDYHEDYLNSVSGFEEFLERNGDYLSLDPEDVKKAKKSKYPFDSLSDTGRFCKYQEINELVSLDEEFLFGEIELDDSVGVAYELLPINNPDLEPWLTLSNIAYKREGYTSEEALRFIRFGYALLIQPHTIISSVDESEMDFNTIVGICPSCHAVCESQVYLQIESYEDFPSCKNCCAEVNIRAWNLCWLFEIGVLLVDPKILLDQENDWILWPNELNSPVVKSEIFPKTH